MSTGMNIYFAPMEGITGYLFRQAYEKNFGGIDCYYTPFVTTRDGGIMKKKEKRDILPENNPGCKIVPQIMTNRAKDFCQSAEQIAEMGYQEVNLNLGCPSGTIVPKGKGAGFLRKPEELDHFLEEIFEHCSISISIKSRIGFYNAEEFPKLLEIYNQYPVKELILHLRTREEFYKEPVHREVFSYAMVYSKNPLCYNGDVASVEDVAEIKKLFPSLGSIMIGRGFLKYPGFLNQQENMNLNRIHNFLLDLEQAYEEVMSGEIPVLFKMKEIWTYLCFSFPGGQNYFKRIKKMKKLGEYKKFIEEIFALESSM